MHSVRIGFIGCGNMANSLISGLVRGSFNLKDICVYDRNKDKLDAVKINYGISTCDSLNTLVTKSDLLIIAIKPQGLGDLAKQIRSLIKFKNPVLISVCAGITTRQLEIWFGKIVPIVRAMPNTPAIMQSGATGIYANSQVATQQKSIVEQVFRTSGVAIWIDNEELMDIIGAISGSGPAYFFLFMEILADLGTSLGLKINDAKLLAIQTAYGASRMALESETPDLEGLRRNVTSKGGITDAAIMSFETSGIREIFKKAILSNIQKGKELSSLFKDTPKLLD